MSHRERESPPDAATLARRVAEITAAGEAVYPVGGATGLDYGGVGERPGVELCLDRLDRIIDYPHEDLTITVEAGLRWTSLQKLLAGRGQCLPVDVPDADRATVGGAVSVDVSGPRRLGRGTFRDHLIGITVVNDNGEFCAAGGRVVKNVAGYDLGKLYIGSLGCFGIISQVTFKLRPVTPAIAWCVVAIPRAQVADTLDRLARSTTRPLAVELLNSLAAQAVGQVIDSEEACLAVLFEDSAAAVDWQVSRLHEELSHPVTRLEPEAGRSLERALTASPAVADQPASIIATTRPSGVADLFSRSSPQDSWHAHALSGVVRIGRSEPDLEWARATLGHVRATGGNVVVRRWPAGIASPERWGRPPSGIELMKAVKREFDPRGLLNPGRTIFG